MKMLAGFAAIITISTPGFADTYVNGYYRNDGAYVRPHVRSSPDSTRANNYGPSNGTTYGLMTPYGRDADADGADNLFDGNDDNDWLIDDLDSSQYTYGGTKSGW